MSEEYDKYRYEKAKAWLEHVRELGIEVQRINGMVESERALLDGVRGIDYTREYVGGSRDLPDVANIVDRLFDHIREYTASLAAYIDERTRAAQALEGLEDPIERRAITEHYLMGRTWEQVRTGLGFSWQGMMTLRRRAILSAYDVTPAGWRDPIPPAL